MPGSPPLHGVEDAFFLPEAEEVSVMSMSDVLSILSLIVSVASFVVSMYFIGKSEGRNK